MNKSEIFTLLFSEWKNERLVEFVLKRTSYCGDNGYFGLDYPGDPEDCIPNGCVEITYWAGEEKLMQIKEEEYIATLREHLIKEGCTELAFKLRSA
jgi:hypothetical protein